MKPEEIKDYFLNELVSDFTLLKVVFRSGVFVCGLSSEIKFELMYDFRIFKYEHHGVSLVNSFIYEGRSRSHFLLSRIWTLEEPIINLVHIVLTILLFQSNFSLICGVMKSVI